MFSIVRSNGEVVGPPAGTRSSVGLQRPRRAA